MIELAHGRIELGSNDVAKLLSYPRLEVVANGVFVYAIDIPRHIEE